MKRTHLLYDHSVGVYLAATIAELKADADWSDVTNDARHTRAAVMQGEWVGSNPLPRDLCLKASEHGEQAALFCWAAAVANIGIDPRKDVMKMYAVPNGGKRDPKTAAMLKAEGVRVGVPDVCLPVPVFADAGGPHYKHFHETQPFGGVLVGLYIEMKKVKGGSLSDDQKERIDALRADGYAAVRCNGWLEARDVVVAYLGLFV
uniref:VRR-NUC domain protein n=1 Tax=Pseudomonas phage Pavpe01 TaxID=3138545 RepID=A0AAU6VZX3_9VIRU